MKVVKFKGGLGNQLFQYAFLKNLEVVFGFDVKADFSYYDFISNDKIRLPRIKELNVKLTDVTKDELERILIFPRKGNPKVLKYKMLTYFEKTFNRQYYFEPDRKYRDIIMIKDFTYFDGYWQSWRYVNPVAEFLRRELRPKNEMREETRRMVEDLKNDNSVFIGIRRGDYLESRKNRRLFGTFDSVYFNKAIDIIKAETLNPTFYVFSNDVTWVKNNIRFNTKNIVFRDYNESTNDVEELFIMAACKHAIITNSTFYWWAAWLISNEGKIVVAPKRWFADGSPIDIVPDEWFKI